MSIHLQLRAQGKLPTCEECRLCDGNLLRWWGAVPADILFLSDFPRHDDVQRGSWQSGAGQTFLKLLKIVVDKSGAYSPISKLRFHAGYALQCGFSDPDKSKKVKPHPSDAALCHFRNTRLTQVKPQMIVCMGKLATQSLGIKVDDFNKMRGTCTETTIDGISYKVYITFHPAAVYLSSGLTNTFMRDLQNILETTCFGTKPYADNIRQKIEHYEFPKTWEAVKDLSERIVAYNDGLTPISVDTETNTLLMHLDVTNPNRRNEDPARCIAFSVAWDVRKSAAWLMQHKKLNEEDPEEFWRRLPFVFNILMSNQPKVAHNFQFDLRVFHHLVRILLKKCGDDPSYISWFEKYCHYSLADLQTHLGIKNIAWDSMLGEHALEEDKKGFYGLKPLTRKYEPEFAGYEQALKAQEGDAAIRLISSKDFVAYVSSLEHIIALRESLKNFPFWLEFTKADQPCEFPSAIFPEFPENATVSEFWEILKKDKQWMTSVKKYVQSQFPLDPKQVWDTFRTKAVYRKTIFDTQQCPDYVRAFEWYIWFASYHKKDIVKPVIVEQARSIREAFAKEREQVNYENFDPDELLVYAAIDTDMALSATGRQLPLLEAEEKKQPSIAYANCAQSTSFSAVQLVSIPVCGALSKMVNNGVKVDFDYLEKLDSIYIEQAREMKDKVFELARIPSGVLDGVSLNLNSADQVINMLRHVGLADMLTEKTATGKLSVTKSVLRSISANLGTPKGSHDVCSALLLYRESLKASKTFLNNFRLGAQWDGRVHPSFHQTGTATYRLSSSGPNFQNISHYLAGHNLKKCIVASRPDWCIVNVDAAGAEVKTLTAYLAQMTGEHRGQQLIESMNSDPDFDIHSQFCAFIFGPSEFGLSINNPAEWQAAYEWVRANKKTSAVEKARKKTKTAVFGTLYGQTARGLASMQNIPLEEAEFIIRQFFKADPAIEAYVNWSQEFVATFGYITTILGRRRRFPTANLDKKLLSRAKRQATNFLIQSLTVDIFNYLIARFIPILEQELGGMPLLQVHDALVMEMPISSLKKARTLFQQHFTEKVKEDFPWFPVAFSCDAEAGDNYGELMSINDYLEMKGQKDIAPTLVSMVDYLDEKEGEADYRLKIAGESDPDEAHLIDDLFDATEDSGTGE